MITVHNLAIVPDSGAAISGNTVEDRTSSSAIHLTALPDWTAPDPICVPEPSRFYQLSLDFSTFVVEYCVD